MRWIFATESARTALRLTVAFLLLCATGDVRAEIQATYYKGRLDTTRAGNTSASQSRRWAASHIGEIISNKDQAVSTGTSIWMQHGWGSGPSRLEGPAATSYIVGTQYNEIVAYVATSGAINVGRIIDNGPIAWYAFNPPTNKILTGHVAAGSFVSGTTRYIAIAATATDASTGAVSLYRLVGNEATLGLDPLFWTDSTGGLAWLPDNPIAVTVNSSNTILSFFASHGAAGQESLGMLRFNSSWAVTNLSRPAGERVCRSIAAAQGALLITAGNYRVAVVCTSHAGDQEVYLATATSETSTTFSWSISSTQPIVPQSVAAVLRPSTKTGSSYLIDVYITARYGTEIFKGVLGTTSFTVTSLGAGGDSAAGAGDLVGGITAIPWGLTSRMFYVHSLNNARNLLYERYGGSGSSGPENYRALGDEDFASPSTGWTGAPRAEGKVSTWRGTMAASVILRPGSGGLSDWPGIDFIYSADEGESSWFAPQPIPNFVNGTSYQYLSDPTAAVTDQRTMYSVQLGAHFTPAQCSTANNIDGVAVYAVSTTPGTYPTFSSPIVFAAQSGLTMDHPSSDIQRVTGASDILHVVWWKFPGSGISYARLTEGSTTPSVYSLSSTGGGAVRVTASDSGRVIAYYGTDTGGTGGTLEDVMFCEVALIGGVYACAGGGFQPIDPGPVQQGYPNKFSTPQGGVGGPGISGGNVYIRSPEPYSLALSESGDKLYYCFHRNEGQTPGTPGNGGNPNDGDTREETDVFCTVGTRSPEGVWTWMQTPIAIGPTLDDHDQFAPEVMVTREQASYSSGGETVIVTYYDRSDDPLNEVYTVKKAISTDGLVTINAPRVMFGGATSTPNDLPRHCFSADQRFIGDYAASEGDTVHGRTLSVLARSPGTIETTIRVNHSSLGHWDR
jgi:hypothetical protein